MHSGLAPTRSEQIAGHLATGCWNAVLVPHCPENTEPRLAPAATPTARGPDQPRKLHESRSTGSNQRRAPPAHAWTCGFATQRQRHSAYDGAMATSPKAQRVEALRRKQSDLRKKVAKSTSDVAFNMGKAADCRTAAAKSRSAATVKSKMCQADQHEAKAIAAERTRAKLESEIARRDAELVRALGEVDKERESEERRTRKKDEARVKALEDRLHGEQARSDPLGNIGRGSAPAEWDFFISYASVDKATTVRPLAEVLRAGGARVWFDEFELRVGDDLRARIDDGLARSRFGVVVLSSAFLAGRHWTDNELSGLFASQKRILPIWHHVSHDEVAGYSPILAGRVALTTATMSLDAIAAELLAFITD